MEIKSRGAQPGEVPMREVVASVQRVGQGEKATDELTLQRDSCRLLMGHLATLTRQLEERGKEMDAVWCHLMKVSPWSPSNDMDWSDEIICGIGQLEQQLEEAREALRIVRDWRTPVTLSRNGEPSTYETEYGSEGVKRYMREVAEAALRRTASPEVK